MFHHARDRAEDMEADLSAGMTEDEDSDLGDDAQDDLSGYMEDYGTIDEAMLRDLVAEIVRQELQGALGERITRNVRKLVRREIYRVVASQDYD